MTNLMVECREPYGDAGESTEATWAEVSRLRLAADAVVGLATRVFSPLPENASDGMSEHFRHAEKRNDPRPAVDAYIARV